MKRDLKIQAQIILTSPSIILMLFANRYVNITVKQLLNNIY